MKIISHEAFLLISAYDFYRLLHTAKGDYFPCRQHVTPCFLWRLPLVMPCMKDFLIVSCLLLFTHSDKEAYRKKPAGNKGRHSAFFFYIGHWSQSK